MLIIIKQKCRKLLRFAGIIANECEQTIERQRKHQLLRQFSQKTNERKKTATAEKHIRANERSEIQRTKKKNGHTESQRQYTRHSIGSLFLYLI